MYIHAPAQVAKQQYPTDAAARVEYITGDYMKSFEEIKKEFSHCTRTSDWAELYAYYVHTGHPCTFDIQLLIESRFTGYTSEYIIQTGDTLAANATLWQSQ